MRRTAELKTTEHMPDLQNGFAYASVVILLLLIFAPFTQDNATFDSNVFLLVVNGIMGTALLWISMCDAPYSLRQVHWIFFVTFFSIAPLNQYMNHFWPWGYTPAGTQVTIVALLTFLWGVLFAIFSGRETAASQKHVGCNHPALSKKMEFYLTPVARILLPVGSIACVALLVALVGLNNLFTRTSSGVNLDSTTLSLVVYVCPRAFVFGSFALMALACRKDKGCWAGATVTAVCLVLTCFPTALARFNVAAIYLGLAILLLPIFSRKRGLFSFVLILGFLVAYPLFDAFKYIQSDNNATEIISIIANSLTAGYSTGNYDAFSIMFWCLDYVEKFGFTFGSQFVGALLFFIPRSIWQDKPVPSGELVFSSFNYPFTDMSFALPFEGFINWGIVGLVSFAVLSGLLAKKLDGKYWANRMNGNSDRVAVLNLFYPFLLCLVFYLLRGSMMTTFTFIFGDLAVMALLYAIANSLEKRERNHLNKSSVFSRDGWE